MDFLETLSPLGKEEHLYTLIQSCKQGSFHFRNKRGDLFPAYLDFSSSTILTVIYMIIVVANIWVFTTYQPPTALHKLSNSENNPLQYMPVLPSHLSLAEVLEGTQSHESIEKCIKTSNHTQSESKSLILDHYDALPLILQLWL